MPDPQIAQQAAAFVPTLTVALVVSVTTLAACGLCFAWAGHKLREVF
jgi:hypothetical protein